MLDAFPTERWQNYHNNQNTDRVKEVRGVTVAEQKCCQNGKTLFPICIVPQTGKQLCKQLTKYNMNCKH